METQENVAVVRKEYSPPADMEKVIHKQLRMFGEIVDIDFVYSHTGKTGTKHISSKTIVPTTTEEAKAFCTPTNIRGFRTSQGYKNPFAWYAKNEKIEFLEDGRVSIVLKDATEPTIYTPQLKYIMTNSNDIKPSVTMEKEGTQTELAEENFFSVEE